MMNTFTLDGKLADTRVNSIHILVGLLNSGGLKVFSPFDTAPHPRDKRHGRQLTETNLKINYLSFSCQTVARRARKE